MVSRKGQFVKQRDFSFHLSQEELASIPIISPLSKKQEQYLNSTSSITVAGGAMGSGKSFTSLVHVLQCALTDKNFTATLGRKSKEQLKGVGGLLETGTKLFEKFGARTNYQELQWRFSNGAYVGCLRVNGNEGDFNGVQATQIVLDEAQYMSEEDVVYLLTRNRSESFHRHGIRLTCNPKRDSFLCDLIKGLYLDEDGFPIPEMSNVETYWIQIQGRMELHRTRKDIEELYGKDIAKQALTFRFIFMTAYDNPALRKSSPGYIHNLENQKKSDRDRNLLGNWFSDNEASGYFKRSWVELINANEVPLGIPSIRAYDLAHTKPVPDGTPDQKNPDHTRGIKASYDKSTDTFYITDMVSCRDRPAIVDQLIMDTARKDGKDTYVCIPIDPGAGRVVYDQKRSKLLSNGFKVVGDKTTSSKLKRSEPFLIALQESRVKVVKGVFKNADWNELEGFTGERTKRGQHDDIMDAIASAYNSLIKGNLIPTISMPARNSPRMKALGGSTLLT